MATLPPVPPALKAIQPYMKIALEHDNRDPVIAYWCRLFSLQAGLKIDRKSKDSLAFLTGIMDWLEKEKIRLSGNEAVFNEVVAQAHIENYALKLFLWADAEDRKGNFNKNVVKSFFTAGIIFDLLQTYGELTEEVSQQRKYSKWKATYIHNCLKNGITPQAGPNQEEEQFDDFQPGASGMSLPVFPTLPDQNGYGTTPSSASLSVPGSHAPPSSPSSSNQVSPSSTAQISTICATNGSPLSAEDFARVQKYCKFAGSALQYEDVPTAIDYLQRALLMLTTGTQQH